MKIGIDARALLHPQKTGLEWYVANLIRALEEIDQKNQYILYLNQDTQQKFSLNFKKRVLFWPILGFNQIRLPLDFLFSQSDVFLFPVLVRPFYCPMPSVCVIHDLNFLRYPSFYSFLNRLRLKTTVKLAALKSDLIISPSYSTKKDLIDFYQVKPSKIRVIYEGFDQKTFSPAVPSFIEKTKDKYKLESPYLIHIAGRFQKQKNTKRVIEAFKIIKKEFENLKLVIVGKKEKNSECQYLPCSAQTKKLRLSSDVYFLGYLPKEDLPPLLSGSTLALFPSLFEGFGLPALEAMACKTVVVVSNRSSLPEIVQEKELLVNPEDLKDLANKISFLIKNPSVLSKMREKCLKRSKDFSWGRCAKETLGVLEEARRQ